MNFASLHIHFCIYFAVCVLRYLKISNVEPVYVSKSDCYVYTFTLQFSSIDFLFIQFSQRFRILFEFHTNIDSSQLPFFPEKTWNRVRSPQKLQNRAQKLKRYNFFVIYKVVLSFIF